MSGPLAGIKRHPDFWLDDGNFILVANRDTAFHIYAGLLASQSHIFADMFTLASSSADEVYEGCHVVPVYDTPGEFAHFLRILMSKKSRNFYWTPIDSPFTFDHTATIIRLVHKYGLPAVRDQAVSILQQDAFPSYSSQPFYRTYPNPILIVEDMHAIGAVNIARLVDKPTLLLPALYRCAVLGSAVLDGWTCDDEVVEHLSPVDLKLCMDALAALAHESITIFTATFEDMPHKDCEGRKECRAGLRALENAMLHDEFRKDHDILDKLQRDIVERADTPRVCNDCRRMLGERRRAMQQDV
ncbi:hypothetical protein LXA43DRAFT_1090983 [Ganoderma leucocontextum]|nr:hypothetical protein LXA43DRAFT_1090983 [Ganoderma leucocontextum]